LKESAGCCCVAGREPAGNLNHVSWCSTTKDRILQEGDGDIRNDFGMGYLHSCSEAELNFKDFIMDEGRDVKRVL
jgi:hypothetical protein